MSMAVTAAAAAELPFGPARLLNARLLLMLRSSLEITGAFRPDRLAPLVAIQKDSCTRCEDGMRLSE
jgi:hypothetical protein